MTECTTPDYCLACGSAESMCECERKSRTGEDLQVLYAAEKGRAEMLLALLGAREEKFTATPGQRLPPVLGFLCNVLLKIFRETPEAKNFLEVTFSDADEELWTLRLQKAAPATAGKAER